MKKKRLDNFWLLTFLCANQIVFLSWDVPGERSLSRDFCCCPCPGTKRQLGNPSLDQLQIARWKGLIEAKAGPNSSTWINYITFWLKNTKLHAWIMRWSYCNSAKFILASANYNVHTHLWIYLGNKQAPYSFILVCLFIRDFRV